MAGDELVPPAANVTKISPRLSRASIGAPVLQTEPEDLGTMPEKEELERQFRVLMESMNVSPEHEKDLLDMPDDRKWKLVRNDMQRRILAALPAEYFCDQLRRHLDTDARKKSKKTKQKGLEPSFELLKKLEVLLRTTAASWVEEFVDHPNNGHLLILEFVADLPAAAHLKGQPRVARSAGEHHLCVLCVRALMRHDYAFRKIVSEDGFVNQMSLSIRNENLRTRVAALQILALAASDPGGGVMVVMDAMHYYSAMVGEPIRFLQLMEMLGDPNQAQEFQLAAMQLVTNLVNHAPDLNTLVYIQADLARAGLIRLLETLGTSSNPDIRKLAREYRNKLVNVDSIVQSREENYQLYHETVDQVNAMQETLESVTRQRDELRQLHKEAQLKATELQTTLIGARKEKEQLAGKLAQVTDLLVEQQELVASTQQQLRETEEQHRYTAEQLSELAKRKGPINYSRQPPPMQPAPPPPATATAAPPAPEATDATKPEEPAANIPPPPPLMGAVPPPPAPPPPGGLSGDGAVPPPPPMMMGASYAPPGMRPKRRIQPNVPLPMLNWVPLRKVDETIFAELDDENILAEVDFKEFEKEFKVRDISAKLPVVDKSQKPKRITVLEKNRARNLVITCRRIDLPYADVREAVDGTDLVSLPPELAELLINYIPTDEEAEALRKHDRERDRLNEAERFMLEMLPIERYESKLRIMAYIGYFDEIYLTVQPQIEAVLKASEALVTSLSFRKVLEIILAFGNYMNSAKRGPAYGFKLPTFERLLDTKSTDRSITLLDFVSQTIEAHYPQVATWCDDLICLKEAARVSMVTLTTDVQGLRKGIDLILYEREKQQQNFVVHSFYSSAVSKVSRASERYRVMQERYSEVCTLFNENAAVLEPFDFFAVFQRFVENYQKSVTDRANRLEAERKQAALEAMAEDLPSRKKAGKSQQAGRQKQGGGKTGGAQKKRGRQAGMNPVELPPHPILNTTSKRPF